MLDARGETGKRERGREPRLRVLLRPQQHRD
jgi:hypothetical protein